MRHALALTLAGFIAATAGAPTGALAAELHALDDIRAAARDFLLAGASPGAGRPGVEVGRLDSRLRLTRCDLPLETFLPQGARATGNTIVGVRCAGASRWTLHVPARVRAWAQVVVLARPLARGEIVTAAHLDADERDVMRLYGGYFLDRERVVGMQAKRSLGAGHVLGPTVVEAPKVISRGQRVTVLARWRGFEVRSVGTALADGAPGDIVRVRNLRSSRIVEGTVSDSGDVEVKE